LYSSKVNYLGDWLVDAQLLERKPKNEEEEKKRKTIRK
jgi:hypothetical protein